MEELNNNILKLIEKIDRYNSFEYKLDMKIRMEGLEEQYKIYPKKKYCSRCRFNNGSNCWNESCNLTVKDYEEERNRIQNTLHFKKRKF